MNACLYLLAQVDTDLANRVAEGLGLSVPKKLDKPMNMSVPADGDPRKFQPKRVTEELEPSPALRMVDNPNFPAESIKTRKIAFLVADGFDDAAVSEVKMAVDESGREGDDGRAATRSVNGSRRRYAQRGL